MEIKFTLEILRCFEEQYPEKLENYMQLISGNKGEFKERAKTYEDMMETFPFLTELIIKLTPINDSGKGGK